MTGSAHALSLGKMRGAALLGQPLEVSVAAQLAAEEDAGGLCAAAEVVYGDSLVEAAAVSTRVQATPGGGTSIVVSVRRLVDEPVVTVYLRAACRAPVSRKYVLLAELVSETLPVLKTPEAASPASVTRLPTEVKGAAEPQAVPAVVPMASGHAKLAPAIRPQGRTPQGEAAVSAKSPSQVRPVQEIPLPGRVSTQRKPVASGSGSRLKLTPLELSQDWEPNLRISTSLSESSPPADAAQRLQAQALWRILQSSPEEMLQQAQQRASLEKELAELTRQSRSNQQAIVELGSTLRKAQDSRMVNPALIVLLVLLVVCGAALAVRARAGTAPAVPWWTGRGKEAGDSQAPMSRPMYPPEVVRSEGVSTTASADAFEPKAEEQGSMPGGRDPTVLPSSLPSSAKGSRGAANATVSSFRPSDFAHSVTGALRSINTQEMLDVRQQAEFFLALGQHDEATRLLQTALSHSSESNPHIYLDLLDLLHRLGRKDDYEHTREAFVGRYTGVVPGFADYGLPSKGLLDYPAVLDVLVRVWDSRFALEYLEQCLVREQSDAPLAGFGLEAFRELLLLHAVRSQVEPEHPLEGGTRPAFRVLPAHDSPLGAPGLKASWGTSAPLDLDLS